MLVQHLVYFIQNFFFVGSKTSFRMIRMIRIDSERFFDGLNCI